LVLQRRLRYPRGLVRRRGLWTIGRVSLMETRFSSPFPEIKNESALGELHLVTRGEMLTGILEMPDDLNNHLPATSLRVILRAGVAYLDVELTIKDKAKNNWPEADWLCLPFSLDSPQFRVARTLGVMDPARDIMPGSNRHMYAVGAGLTITGSD